MSVDGVHERLTLVEVTPETESPVGTDGAVVSGGASVCAETGADCGETLPAASKATTEYVYPADELRPVSTNVVFVVALA